MSPRPTKAMIDKAQREGADVSQKRKVQKPKAPKPEAKPQVPDRSDEIAAFRSEIAGLKQALEDQKKVAEMKSQELVALISGLSESKPMRVKPIRDLDPKSKQYLLVQHYDLVPVEYRPKRLDS